MFCYEGGRRKKKGQKSTNSNLIADAVGLGTQPWADLPQLHPRLQLLNIRHRLPRDFVVHLAKQYAARGTNKQDIHRLDKLSGRIEKEISAQAAAER